MELAREREEKRHVIKVVKVKDDLWKVAAAERMEICRRCGVASKEADA